MKRYIFLEGLPGVGKTTIINYIKERYSNVNVVDEIINEVILKQTSFSEDDFIKNDEMKLNKYKDGVIIFDRGPISSLSYSQVKKIIDNNYDISKALKLFEKYRDIFKEDCKIVYLTNGGKEYFIPSFSDISPYGTVDNQKLLEAISLYNCKKYCSNVIVIDYNKDNMEEVVNEIIS